VLLDGFDRDRIVLDHLRPAMSLLIIIGHCRLLDAGPAREPRNVTPLPGRWASRACAGRGARQVLMHWGQLVRPAAPERSGPEREAPSSLPIRSPKMIARSRGSAAPAVLIRDFNYSRVPGG
jgi:hypothetical protein